MIANLERKRPGYPQSPLRPTDFAAPSTLGCSQHQIGEQANQAASRAASSFRGYRFRLLALLVMLAVPAQVHAQQTRPSQLSATSNEVLNSHFASDAISLPDLIFLLMSYSSVLPQGGGFRFSGLVANQGTAPAFGTISVGAWLTVDGDPFNQSGDEIPMGGGFVSFPPGGLAPGESTSFSFGSIISPTNLTPVCQVFTVCADIGTFPPCQAICETDDFNNCVNVDVCPVPVPDLTLTLLNHPDTSPQGQGFSFDGLISNEGLVPAFFGVNVGAYLTLDGDPFNHSGDEIPMGGGFVAFPPLGLAPGGSMPFQFESLNVPTNAVPLPQIFTVCVDTGTFPPCQLICEIDEFNNCDNVPISILGPDLTLMIESAPDAIPQNGHFSFSGLVKNDGVVPAFGTINVGSWLTLDGIFDPPSGDEIIMGGGTVTFPPEGLAPQESMPFQFDSLNLPPSAATQCQVFSVCADTGNSPPCQAICETDDFNNCADTPICVIGPDAGVVGLSFPSPILSPNLAPVVPAPIDVTVQNFSLEPLDIPVTVTIGPSFVNCLASGVQPGQQQTITCSIIPPLSPLNCGAADPFEIVACTTLAIDVVPSNNCATDIIQVVEQWWDLELNVFGNPSSVVRNFCNQPPNTVGWRVRVTNVGNFPFTAFPPGNSCLLQTAIVPGSGQTNCQFPVAVDGIRFSGIPNLNPNASWDFVVSNYRILCGAFLGTQFVKAEFCCDQCSVGTNWDQEPITIVPP